MPNKTTHFFIYGQIAVILMAILVRLINLNGSFWLDEAAQVLESARPLSKQLQIKGDFQPPLYHYLVHFWLLGGTSEWWLRLTSLIPALITIWVVMLLGKKLFSPTVGLTAGVLLASSQFHTFYSQELRPYSLATMWAVLAVFGYYRILENKKSGIVILTLSAIAGLYTMYMFPLLIITLAIITLVWHREYFNKIFLSLGFVAISFLPWLPSFLDQLQVGTDYAQSTPAWNTMVSPPLWKMLPLVIAKFLVGRINVDFALKDIMLIGSLVAVLVFLISRASKFKATKEIMIWLFAPILMAFLISFKVPVLDPKRVMFCLPALYLLVAAGIGKGYKSALALLVFLSINMISLSKYATDPNQQREPWRQVVQDIEQASLPGDKVVFVFSAPFAPWAWYQTKQLPTVSIENPPLFLNNAQSLEMTLSGAPDVFVFDYLHELTDPNKSLLNAIKANGYQESSTVSYPQIGKVHLFQRGAAVATIN